MRDGGWDVCSHWFCEAGPSDLLKSSCDFDCLDTG